MAFIDHYHDFVMTSLESVHKENQEALESGAKLLLECEKKKGTIYTFGTGHSHMIGQDVYARAGGYAKIYPIVEIELTLATHPTKSTKLERCAEYADVLDELYPIHENDTILVTSNSGRNSLVIEFVLRAKEKGAKIIVITSLTHSKTIHSRHSSVKRLFELGDVVLDNKAPYGDAGIAMDSQTRMGPLSTMSGCYLAQCLVGRFVELLKENHMDAPVFRSSNMENGDAYNASLFENYVIAKRKN